MISRDAVILVTGARGLVGANLVEHLRAEGFKYVVGIGSDECDLTQRDATLACFENIRPNYVFHMAGYVFGIMGNMQNQGEAYLRNLLINTNVVDACHRVKVEKIVAMGTVAMYPFPLPSDPLREDTVWMGAPHGSERGYAHAKRGMLAQLEVYHESYGMDYAFALSTNLYGPYDRFNIETGHVIPALIRKFYEAKQNGGSVSIWGNGSAQRDFIYIKDTVRGLQWMLEKMDGAINLATGHSVTIRDAVDILAAHTGMQDKVVWDASKPNGQGYRAYDTSKLKNSGFSCQYSLQQGLQETYDWYANNHATARKK
jgi:GDP-L-fucose synthase